MVDFDFGVAKGQLILRRKAGTGDEEDGDEDEKPASKDDEDDENSAPTGSKRKAEGAEQAEPRKKAKLAEESGSDENHLVKLFVRLKHEKAAKDEMEDTPKGVIEFRGLGKAREDEGDGPARAQPYQSFTVKLSLAGFGSGIAFATRKASGGVEK